MRKRIWPVLIVLLGLITFVGCSETEATKSSSKVTSAATTSATEATTKATTIIETTSEVIETTEELVLEEVYESEDFPEVDIIREGTSKFHISVNVDGIYFEASEDLNQETSTYSVTRVDKKVISVFLFGMTFADRLPDDSNDRTLRTTVLSTSGDRINLSDIVSNEEAFQDYLDNKGVEESYDTIDEWEWCFDLSGISIFDLENGIVEIPYEDFEGILNTNYCLDEGPFYGFLGEVVPGITVNDHVIRYEHKLHQELYIDDELITEYVNDEGDVLEVPASVFFFVTDDSRCFIWANKNASDGICGMLVELSSGYPIVVATLYDGLNYYENIYDIPEDILELMNISEW